MNHIKIKSKEGNPLIDSIDKLASKHAHEHVLGDSSIFWVRVNLEHLL